MLADSYVYDLLRKLGLTPFGARTGEFLLVRPLKVLLIVLAAVILSRILTRWIVRSVRSLQLRTPLLADSPRAQLRATTIADVVGNFSRAVIWFIAVLLICDQLGVNLAPLLAGAGIAGIAIGFGAQSLVKDVLSGLFLLLEDQYGVGDTVTLLDETGTVEQVDLRVTRLRSVDGKVWFVPNGEVRKVGNGSLGWARAVVDVLVGHDADVGAAITAIDDEVGAMANEAQWADAVLDAPEVWGVESVTTDGITIRVALRTKPGDRVRVERALRARISSRLRREGVATPGHTVVVNPPASA